MGTPDTYGDLGIQLKNGEPCCRHYKIGANVDLPDGIYIGFEGAVVVKDGKYVMDFPSESVLDKWGNEVDIRSRNPVQQAVDEISQQYSLRHYYFIYYEGNLYLEGFHITTKKCFDEEGCCSDWHLTGELQGLLPAGFTEVSEGVFTYDGSPDEGRQQLLDRGMVENKKILP